MSEKIVLKRWKQNLKNNYISPFWVAVLLAGCQASVSEYDHLVTQMDTGGTPRALAYFDSLHEAGSTQANEFMLNRLGYALLADDKQTEALDIFRYNVQRFPEAGNPADSYGEALMLAGETDAAKEAYLTSVRLNPVNENGYQKLRELGYRFTASQASFDTFLNEYIAWTSKSWDVPGVVAAIVNKDSIITLAAAGQANPDVSLLVAPEQMVFPVASVTKLLTAVAILSFVEEGTVDLETDINTYLKSIQIPAFEGAPLTLRHLLTHTGGFDESNEGRYTLEDLSDASLASYLSGHLPPRIRAPGKVWQYSNHGIALAALVVEEVNGQPFSAILNERVFIPLGLKNTRLGFGDQPTARGYSEEGTPYPHHWMRTVPASMISSTVEDLGRFASMVLSGGEWEGSQVVSDETVQSMLTRQFSHHQEDPGIGLVFLEGSSSAYSRQFFHTGQTRGIATGLHVLPELELGLIILYNSDVGTASANLANAFMARFYPDQPVASTREKNEAAQLPSVSEDLVGTYRFVRYAHTTAEKLPAILLGRAAEIQVGKHADGGLSLNGAHYLPTSSPARFKSAGASVYAGFIMEEGTPTHLYINRNAYERIRTWEAQSVQDILFFGQVLLNILALALLVVTGFLARKRRAADENSGFSRLLNRLAITQTVVSLLFLAGILVYVRLLVEHEIWDMLFGFPAWFKAVGILPPVVLLLALSVFSSAFFFGKLHRGQKILITSVAFLGVFTFTFAWWWNLVGWL